MKKNVAVVGCGNISDIYLSNMTGVFDNVNVYAVCDLDELKSREKAEKYNTKVMSFDEILSDKNIDIVLNLTTPFSHYDICKKTILAKKNIYVEKPLSISYSEGKELVDLAQQNDVLIGCAPDTFMGAGIHTARKIIDDGLIGEIMGATAFMVCPGHESCHPSPEFYYKVGGGPLFDMGPYYITALINLIGSVKSVAGMANCLRKQRKITSQPKYGEIIDAEVATHVNALMKFKNGAITIANHVLIWDYICILKAIRPHLQYHPGWKTNFEGPNGPLIRWVGGIPIPTGDMRAMAKFQEAIGEVLKNNHWWKKSSESYVYDLIYDGSAVRNPPVMQETWV